VGGAVVGGGVVGGVVVGVDGQPIAIRLMASKIASGTSNTLFFNCFASLANDSVNYIPSC
jgi:hypothetical protein